MLPGAGELWGGQTPPLSRCDAVYLGPAALNDPKGSTTAPAIEQILDLRAKAKVVSQATGC